jgi:hypothetical protein
LSTKPQVRFLLPELWPPCIGFRNLDVNQVHVGSIPIGHLGEHFRNSGCPKKSDASPHGAGCACKARGFEFDSQRHLFRPGTPLDPPCLGWLLAHRSSLEWTLPCHGRDHRFESGMGRFFVGTVANGIATELRTQCLRVRLPSVPLADFLGNWATGKTRSLKCKG